MRKALEGIKVIQLANFIAAAATGRYLADHGADVILVESPKGDPIRYTQEQEGRPQNIKENVAWEYLNGNKRCISINTKTEEGKDVGVPQRQQALHLYQHQDRGRQRGTL